MRFSPVGRHPKNRYGTDGTSPPPATSRVAAEVGDDRRMEDAAQVG